MRSSLQKILIWDKKKLIFSCGCKNFFIAALMVFESWKRAEDFFTQLFTVTLSFFYWENYWGMKLKICTRSGTYKSWQLSECEREEKKTQFVYTRGNWTATRRVWHESADRSCLFASTSIFFSLPLLLLELYRFPWVNSIKLLILAFDVGASRVLFS